MKTEAEIGLLPFLWEWVKKIKDGAVAVLYFGAAHFYDGLCATVSNLYSYSKALAIMSAFLFTVSAVLVLARDFVGRFYGWDILSLEHVSELKDRKDIRKHQVFKRLIRWSLRKGHWWTFFVGSILVGPPIITPLLEKKRSQNSRLFYLVAGTLVSTVFWVTVWSGVGVMTWEQYVVPAFKRIF